MDMNRFVVVAVVITCLEHGRTYRMSTSSSGSCMIESSVSEKLRILHKMQIEVPCYSAQPRGLSVPPLS
jgi:hypothetical protein